MRLENAEKVLAQKVAEQNMESYAVLVGIGDEECLITSEDVNEDTYFDIASVGKAAVTTQLVLRAISEERLTLSATLGDFFKNVPQNKAKITVKQLLTHTSGIIRYPISAEICARNNDVIAADILSHGLAFEPGSEYAYSCPGMMLLGFILEKIYGQTLDELFFAKIKHPLGIDRMRFNIAIDEENAAISYERSEVGLRRMDDWTVVLMRNGVSGSGCSFWSVKALKTLVKAILSKDERLYKKELFDIAEQSYTDGMAEKRGLGYGIDKMKGSVDLGGLFPAGSFGHLGWTGCIFFINREKNMYAIILSNTRRCIVKKDPASRQNIGEADSVYVQLRGIFSAVKKDLDEQGLL